jgi:hypothetical protein
MVLLVVECEVVVLKELVVLVMVLLVVECEVVVLKELVVVLVVVPVLVVVWHGLMQLL